MSRDDFTLWNITIDKVADDICRYSKLSDLTLSNGWRVVRRGVKTGQGNVFFGKGSASLSVMVYLAPDNSLDHTVYNVTNIRRGHLYLRGRRALELAETIVLLYEAKGWPIKTALPMKLEEMIANAREFEAA
jgi:hypothetical protein